MKKKQKPFELEDRRFETFAHLPHFDDVLDEYVKTQFLINDPAIKTPTSVSLIHRLEDLRRRMDDFLADPNEEEE